MPRRDVPLPCQQVPIEVLGNRNYHISTLGGYFVGIMATFAINAVTRAGQPALLYLVRSTGLKGRTPRRFSKCSPRRSLRAWAPSC